MSLLRLPLKWDDDVTIVRVGGGGTRDSETGRGEGMELFRGSPAELAGLISGTSDSSSLCAA